MSCCVWRRYSISCLQAPVLDRLLDLELHLLDLERLLHVVEGADLHRLDGGVDRSERRHQDDRGRRMQRLAPCAARPCRRCRPSSDRSARRRTGPRAASRWRRCRSAPPRPRGCASVSARTMPAPQRVVIVCYQNPTHLQCLSLSDDYAAPQRRRRSESLLEQFVAAADRQRDAEARAAVCRRARRRCGRRARRRSCGRWPGRARSPAAWS